MEKLELRVDGMTCSGCVKSIQNALTSRDGVENAAADLDTGKVEIEFDKHVIHRVALEQAIVDAGFEVVG